ncbi:MAG: hypothetical protein ACRCZN_05705 [Lactococcus lactis]
MSKNFDDFVSLLTEDKLAEIVKMHCETNEVSNGSVTSITATLRLLEMYHNWLNSDD